MSIFHPTLLVEQEAFSLFQIVKIELFGIEKKPLPHLLCMTNLLLHDLDTPNILRDNSLSINVRDYSGKDNYDVIAMNPPFGGVEEVGIQINFPMEFRTSETADLFMTLIMYRLKKEKEDKKAFQDTRGGGNGLG